MGADAGQEAGAGSLSILLLPQTSDMIYRPIPIYSLLPLAVIVVPIQSHS